MAFNFLGLRVPTTAEEAGANLHQNARDTFGGMIQRGQQLYMAPYNAGVGVSQGVLDFVHGLSTGKAASADAARAPAPAAQVRAAPQARPAAAQAAQPKPAGTSGTPDPRLPVGAPTFDEILGAYAQAKGGHISIREMEGLADIANKTQTHQRLPVISDIAGQKAIELGDQLANYKIDQAKKSGNTDAYLQAYQEQVDRYERLARARAVDPLSFDEGR